MKRLNIRNARRLLAFGDADTILFSMGKLHGKTDDEIAEALRWSNDQISRARNKAMLRSLAGPK